MEQAVRQIVMSITVRDLIKQGCAQVERGNVKPPPAVEETYRGVAAPSRPKVDDTPQVMEMPKVSLI